MGQGRKLHNNTFMKGSKHDVKTGHYSDHIINGTRKLYVYLSLLFSSMIFHACTTDGVHLSKLNDSNYRTINLSSVLGKQLDRIILSKH